MEIKLPLSNLEELNKLISLLTEIEPRLEGDEKGLQLVQKIKSLAEEIKQKPEQAVPDKKKGVPDRVLKRALQLLDNS